MKKDRRQFLKNTTLAAFSAVLLPRIVKANSSEDDALAAASSCNPTTLDYYGQGPFYTANAPSLVNNLLAATTEPGTRLIVSGRVQNLDCTEFIAGALIDVWQADDAGNYDNSGYKLRGKTTSNSQGFYMFETIYPGKYLNGSAYRPAHIHFKITPPSHPQLTTQLYFQGDPDNSTDAASSITSGTYDARDRIVPVTVNGLGQKEATWDIIVDGNGDPIGIEDMRASMGMIYSVSPNPFSNHIVIKYGVFQNAQVKLSVYNMNGQLVADLSKSNLSPEKYTAEWSPASNLKPGHYFIALQINDVQVHYLKIVKMP